MQPNLKISVITPNYNYSNYIGATIQSVIDQCYDNFEHIIVDDGSTDNSVVVIKGYCNKYPDNIKLIKQENRGQTVAINVGLKRATGNIIGWINSDDTYRPGAFNKIAEAFRKKPVLDAVFGDIYIVNGDDKLIKKKKYLKFDYATGVFKGFGNLIPSNAIFWKYDLMKKIGLLDETFRTSMDSEYWSRLLVNANVQHINEYLANFRWHSKSITILSKDKSKKEHDRSFFENNKIFLSSYKNLTVSKILPVNYSLPLKSFYLAKRVFLRLIKGHYF